MAVKQNLTVQLDDEVIRRAKALAARRGTSVSAMVAQHIDELTAADERYQRARESALRMMAETRDERARLAREEPSDQEPYRWNRDEIHEERLGRYGS